MQNPQLKLTRSWNAQQDDHLIKSLTSFLSKKSLHPKFHSNTDCQPSTHNPSIAHLPIALHVLLPSNRRMGLDNKWLWMSHGPFPDSCFSTQTPPQSPVQPMGLALALNGGSVRALQLWGLMPVGHQAWGPQEEGPSTTNTRLWQWPVLRDHLEHSSASPLPIPFVGPASAL